MYQRAAPHKALPCPLRPSLPGVPGHIAAANTVAIFQKIPATALIHICAASEDPIVDRDCTSCLSLRVIARVR